MKKAIIISVLLLLTINTLSPGEATIGDGCFYISSPTPLTKSVFYQDLMSLKESGNSPDAMNCIGAMGLFGFMEGTLQDLGYNITAAEFKENPSIFPESLQREALAKFTIQNDSLLKDIIDKYIGTITQDSIQVTRAGILAAAHLGGPGSVKRYFETGYVAKDITNTTILDYMKAFENAKINL